MDVIIVKKVLQVLKIHVKAIHEGVKDHVCKHCDKNFSLAASLKLHVKTNLFYS